MADSSSTTKRSKALLLIALLAWAIALAITLAMAGPISRANDFFYDVFYRTRPIQDMQNADVVLVAADQPSLTAVQKKFNYGWPWPREFWGILATYVEKAGAKAVAYDLTFVETSAYQTQTGDDDNFAAAINGLKLPVIFGCTVEKDGHWRTFAPPVKNPTFGAINVGDDKLFRRYPPIVLGKPALALATLQGAGLPVKGSEDTFLLHYYGPHLSPEGNPTFTYLPAARVLAAATEGDEAGAKAGITPDLFKNKIVLFCTIAQGTFDLKSSPLSGEYPGPEVQATALENLLRGDRVHPIPTLAVALLTLLLSLGVTAGVILPRGAQWKALAPLLAVLLLLGAGILLFRGPTIIWLPPVMPLIALVLATPIAFAWTYLAEDRQRRFMLKALSKVVSPEIAEQLARDPGRLQLGTNRAEITLVFTDLANFTELSEGMDVQQLGEFMNRYLGVMSDQVLAQNGTLDKYIGDAIMCFWNAPLPQADHAVRACRAALAMVAREAELQADVAPEVRKKVFTRIGINTAASAVGFVGSSHLFNFTALGDGVNLASRLEGANKLYGTRIILSENTAKLVKDQFWLRRLDILRVKGKLEPMGVYELRAERGKVANEDAHAAIIRLYEEAFDACRRRDWAAAEKLLLELCQRFGEDKAGPALLDRVREYQLHPPDASWDGVYVSKSK